MSRLHPERPPEAARLESSPRIGWSEGPGWLPLVLGAALRLIQIQAPILGIHSWRQADTAAMARNFAEQGMVFWHPQIDWGGAGSGLVEAEFPLYPYAVALLYRLFGVQEWLARGLSALCGVAAIWLVIRIGRRLVGAGAGWWGGLFYAVLPIPVFYGRTVQPEALLMLLAALALERFLAWLEHGRPAALAIAWAAFTGACLIKLLPMVWLGAPLLWLWLRARRGGIVRHPGTWLLPLASLAVTAVWYWHAHRLGQASGLSFGFWGADANRYRWQDLLGFGYWGGLALRILVRNLAVVGLPLLLLGLLPRRDGVGSQARVLPVGLVAVLVAGLMAPESSSVHEYYQLPLMLFACPLMGLGWVRLRSLLRNGPARAAWALPALLLLVSLTILSIDYWSREATGSSAAWSLAQRIRSETAPGSRVVVMSGSDPTVLYLADRKGWLVSPRRLIKRDAGEWQRAGASAVAGSYEVIESFSPFPDGPAKERLRRWVCEQPSGCQEGSSFVIPLGDPVPPPPA